MWDTNCSALPWTQMLTVRQSSPEGMQRAANLSETAQTSDENGGSRFITEFQAMGFYVRSTEY